MVQVRKVVKTGFFFCRMDIKINLTWFYLCKYAGYRVGTVWKKALSTIFNCLYKRIFLNAAAIGINKNIFFI